MWEIVKEEEREDEGKDEYLEHIHSAKSVFTHKEQSREEADSSV